MTSDILLAAELKDLVGEDPVPGYRIRWIASQEPTPRGDYAALVPLLSRRVGREEFEGLPKLKVVANCAVGVDNIDLEQARTRGIVVTNTPDVLTDATADLTWALILAAARRLKEGMRLVESGAWTGWHPTLLLGLELKGRTLGVIGAGRIGQAVAHRAVGFGMRIIYASPSSKPDFERKTGAARVELDTLLAQSDVITLHLPARPDTRKLIDRSKFARMRRGVILVNTARGDLVDEEALLDALEEGTVWAAGLDVFAREPEVDPRLIAHPRVIALPHIGSATEQTRRAMASLAIANVWAVLAGKEPLTPVVR
ncbi:MAG: D-glycerate dehydrogenase [Gemmatimonadales bacterium]|nr:MAG: D-glycerate dehydrogenase [Gemmatimonadales bacterium]